MGFPGKATKDFFISYNQKDKHWAEWVGWELEEAGYTVIVQAWDFGAGSNFVVEMDEAAKNAERTLALLSPTYLASIFTRPEWAAAFADDPTSIGRKLIPIRVEECELTGLLRQIVYIDLVGKEEQDARDILLAQIKVTERAKPISRPSFLGSPQAGSAGGGGRARPRSYGGTRSSRFPHCQRAVSSAVSTPRLFHGARGPTDRAAQCARGRRAHERDTGADRIGRHRQKRKWR